MFSQSGNALLPVILVIGMLLAIWIGLRGANNEADRVIVSERTGALESAVQRLIAQGCKDHEISYETPFGENKNPQAPSDGHCHVYRQNGGQVFYRD